jgi:alcohol dehydrogenase (cytochrome c)
MKHKLLVLGAGCALIAVGGAAAVYYNPTTFIPLVGMAVNYWRSRSAPAGTTTTELASPAGDATDSSTPFKPATPSGASSGDWGSYNKTLTSERYASLDQINTQNVGTLRVLCTYDTKQFTSFESGLIMIDSSLIGTTEHDIFSLDPATCAEKWRTHEDYTPANLLSVNRGAAYLDGRLFRGTQDGRVLAYDFKTGKKLWQTVIADPTLSETTPSAPIAWNGLVFIGNAGGDSKGVKGRMYALNAATGAIVWEFYLVPRQPGDLARGPQGATPLNPATWDNGPQTPISGGATWTSYTLDSATGELYVPGGNPAPDFVDTVRGGEDLYTGSVVVLDAKTGAYKNHFKLVPKDWHDWDVSAAPALIHTRAGRTLLSVAPKDGHLYGIDLTDNKMLYRSPANRIENADQPFSQTSDVHFCPGSAGGAEWNGPAYDPPSNLVFIGEVEWCSTIRLESDEAVQSVKRGMSWTGTATSNPYDALGMQDPYGEWAGWVYAIDADTGVWKWRLKSNYPVMSGMTPTAGGLVFFGDMGGNFYAVDSTNGKPLWHQKIGGGIGGGVITYTANGVQKVAVATGFTSILWPTAVVTAKVMVLGLGEATDSK